MDDLPRGDRLAKSEFEHAQRAFGLFTAQVGGSDPLAVAAAIRNATEHGDDVPALIHGLALVGYLGYERAAKLSGRTVEDEIQEQAAVTAAVIEAFNQQPPA